MKPGIKFGGTIATIFIVLIAGTIMGLATINAAGVFRVNVINYQSDTKLLYAAEAGLQITKAKMYFNTRTDYRNFLDTPPTGLPTSFNGVTIVCTILNNVDDPGYNANTEKGTDLDDILRIRVIASKGTETVRVERETIITTFAKFSLADDSSGTTFGSGYTQVGDSYLKSGSLYNNGIATIDGFFEFGPSASDRTNSNVTWLEDNPLTSPNEGVKQLSSTITFPGASSTSEWNIIYSEATTVIDTIQVWSNGNGNGNGAGFGKGNYGGKKDYMVRMADDGTVIYRTRKGSSGNHWSPWMPLNVGTESDPRYTPQEGDIILFDGDVYISGTYSSSFTIISKDDIYVTGRIEKNPPEGDVTLGLIATDDLWINTDISNNAQKIDYLVQAKGQQNQDDPTGSVVDLNNDGYDWEDVFPFFPPQGSIEAATYAADQNCANKTGVYRDNPYSDTSALVSTSSSGAGNKAISKILKLLYDLDPTKYADVFQDLFGRSSTGSFSSDMNIVWSWLYPQIDNSWLKPYGSLVAKNNAAAGNGNTWETRYYTFDTTLKENPPPGYLVITSTQPEWRAGSYRIYFNN